MGLDLRGLGHFVLQNALTRLSFAALQNVHG